MGYRLLLVPNDDPRDEIHNPWWRNNLALTDKVTVAGIQVTDYTFETVKNPMNYFLRLPIEG